MKLNRPTPYSDEYMTCIEEAKQDLQSGTRPALKSLPDSLEGYDIIYLAYPNYWGTMADGGMDIPGTL